MKRAITTILLLLSCFAYAEVSLGGITLNQTYQETMAMYPFKSSWKSLEPVTLPYPLSLIDREPYYLLESPKLDIQAYFSSKKKVKAITATFYEKEDFTDYETSKGLRLGDSIVELDLLYGKPLDVSYAEYTKEKEGELNIIRIYYYEDLCVYTREFEGLPQIVTNLMVGNYNERKIKRIKKVPINYEKLFNFR